MKKTLITFLFLFLGWLLTNLANGQSNPSAVDEIRVEVTSANETLNISVVNVELGSLIYNGVQASLGNIWVADTDNAIDLGADLDLVERTLTG